MMNPSGGNSVAPAIPHPTLLWDVGIRRYLPEEAQRLTSQVKQVLQL